MTKSIFIAALGAALITAAILSCGGSRTAKKQPAQEEARADFRDKTAGIDMIFVEGGTFTMGCTAEQGMDCGDVEEPEHEVTLSAFYIAKLETTQKLWMSVMDANPSFSIGNDDLPVENISWNDVQEFIKKLNAMTGKKYRLPTEAEWEYAARGGNKSKGYKYSGSNDIDKVAWYGLYNDKGGMKTRYAGTKEANELGIHDMSGNVMEWVNDWYGRYMPDARTNPAGPDAGSQRVLRGGSWDYVASRCRVSHRAGSQPDVSFWIYGFRLALSAPQGPGALHMLNLKIRTTGKQRQAGRTDTFPRRRQRKP